METMSMAEDLIVAPDSLSPLSLPAPRDRKLKRLRKVRTPSEDDLSQAAATGDNGELTSLIISNRESLDGASNIELNVSVGSQRESAEDILRRFGKRKKSREENSADEGKKRNAVQSTIRAAVVDMAKERSMRTEENHSVEEDIPAVADSEAVGDVLELASHLEEDDVAIELLAPNKRKRSNTVKRCSVHATSMTLAVDYKEDMSEGEPGAMDNEEESSQDPTESEEKAEDDDARENSNGGKGDTENQGEAWNPEWSDGLDAEESMEGILAKARKMVAEMSNAENASSKATVEKKRFSDDQINSAENLNGKKKKVRKEDGRRMREDVYAESQRLLRESKGVTFVAPEPVMKPISSVLEKIRQRRLQLGCSHAGPGSLLEADNKPKFSQKIEELSSTHVDLTVDEDTEVVVEMFRSNFVKSELLEEDLSPFNAEQASPMNEGADAAPVPKGRAQEDIAGEDETQRTSRIRTESACADLRQLSNSRPGGGSPNATLPDDCLVAGVTDFMGLETELQDEDSLLRLSRGHTDKEVRDPGLRVPVPSEVYTTATHVRVLIDDEAEDEDEDVLAENKDEEEILGDDEDLQDLIAATQNEKAHDRTQRSALHRKWLDQQDTEQTEDILERLRTGRSSRWKGRDRVVSCLDDDDNLGNARNSEALSNYENEDDVIEPFRDDALPEEDLSGGNSLGLQGRVRNQEQEADCLLGVYEDEAREEPAIEDDFIEDEDEHEKSVYRKRLLEESEEQLVFLSPAEDESSREVFGLINKVNVATLKTKPTSGHSELRLFGSSKVCSLPSKPSFLGRSSSSSSVQPPASKQGGSSGSRSFVFGRDESNSNHGFPTANQEQEDKKSSLAKIGSYQGEKTPKTLGKAEAKNGTQSRSNTGPSLFELLRKQAASLDEALQNSASDAARKWGSNSEAFSVFAPKSFTISRRKS